MKRFLPNFNPPPFSRGKFKIFSPGFCFVSPILILQKAKQAFCTAACNSTKFQISSKGGKLIVKFRFKAHLGIIYHTMTSNNVWIQPWSLSILLKECKCRIIPIKWSSFLFVLLNNNFSQTSKCIFVKIHWHPLVAFFICLFYSIAL